MECNYTFFVGIEAVQQCYSDKQLNTMAPRGLVSQQETKTVLRKSVDNESGELPPMCW